MFLLYLFHLSVQVSLLEQIRSLQQFSQVRIQIKASNKTRTTLTLSPICSIYREGNNCQTL